VGMVAGTAQEFLFSDDKIAGELVWWVDPEYRRGSYGRDLHDAFEYWADKVGCKVITMALLEDQKADKVARLYERKGYRQAERAFIKTIGE
jgi:GNAT superfamily N-acetyltransferase